MRRLLFKEDSAFYEETTRDDERRIVHILMEFWMKILKLRKALYSKKNHLWVMLSINYEDSIILKINIDEHFNCFFCVLGQIKTNI